MSESLYQRLGRQVGEIAVLGLGRSGVAVTRLLAARGYPVYASDAGDGAAVSANAAAVSGGSVQVQIGGHDLARIASSSFVVVSPGVPQTAPPLIMAAQHGVPVVGEMEIALSAMPALRYVAVTGTNGKTTTTALIGAMLRALGREAVDAGNIGVALAEYATRTPVPAWAALECSSFQLHDTPGINPTVGVVTNLSPDHLDRYASVNEYYADKARIFANASQTSRWVLNADEPDVLALHERLQRGGPLAGTVFRFSMRGQADAWFDRESGVLHVLGAPLIDRDTLPLLGDHNVANALTAALAVMVADPAHATETSRATIARTLQSFHALPHRIEPVPTSDGRLWLNDSKATNISSTLVAVQGMTQPFVLLLGGRHKGEAYTALSGPLSHLGKAVVAYGEAAPLIERDLSQHIHVVRVDGNFESVIATARALSGRGDAILLSPACSSYDMFRNYEDRGMTFRRLAQAEAA
jgi:UDP-N-acetylmuramoylalanine--D-glutamate ligase